MRDPIGCDREGAVRYMGCSVSMFDDLTSKGIVRPVRRNWFLYSDLDRAAERLQKERDVENATIKLETTDSVPKKKRNVGVQGGRRYDGITKELLRANER